MKGSGSKPNGSTPQIANSENNFCKSLIRFFTYLCLASYGLSLKHFLSSTNCIPGISARHGLTINDCNHDTRASSETVSETNVSDRCRHLLGAMFHFNELRHPQWIALKPVQIFKVTTFSQGVFKSTFLIFGNVAFFLSFDNFSRHLDPQHDDVQQRTNRYQILAKWKQSNPMKEKKKGSLVSTICFSNSQAAAPMTLI